MSDHSVKEHSLSVLTQVALLTIGYVINESFSDHRSISKIIVALVIAILLFILARLEVPLANGLKRIFPLQWVQRPNANLVSVAKFILVGAAIGYVYTLRTDFDDRVTPRYLTGGQSERLRSSLSNVAGFTVYVKFVKNDPEALEYAGEIYNALRQTNLDLNPPTHGGPVAFTLPDYQQEPHFDDREKNGKPVFHDLSSFMRANNEWVESEIRHSQDENNYPATGLAIEVQWAGQPTNPDPRRPRPDETLLKALRDSGVDVNGTGASFNRGRYEVTLLVGHRPRALSGGAPLLFRIGHWIETLSQ
jgi:hypothetical protein